MIEGFVVMVVGITVVFAFLGLMVLVMQMSALFFTRFTNRFLQVTATNTPDGHETDSTAIAVAIAVVKSHMDGL